jgi:hypothetical protein
MTRTFGLPIAVVLASLALGWTVAPAVAHASPFASFSSAAVDQYSSSSGTGTAGGTGTGGGTGAASGNASATHSNVSKGAKRPSSSHRASGVNGQSKGTTSSGVSGANVGVAPSARPIKTHGTLPFTGLDLTTIVLVALGLLGAGLSLRAAERVNRRRRAGAAS